MFGSHNGSLTPSMVHHRNQLKHFDETMKQAHGCKYQQCEPELKKTTSLTTKGPSKDNHQASTKYLKLHIEAVIESEA